MDDWAALISLVSLIAVRLVSKDIEGRNLTDEDHGDVTTDDQAKPDLAAG